MRNYVAKHDFNRASYHRDRKNSYSRKWDLEEELDYDYRRTMEGDFGECTTYGSEEDS
ncbi:hypothetical protein [Escherichia phage phiWec187]|nr:hypothetical protein [Escherichia phage phiWec187]